MSKPKDIFYFGCAGKNSCGHYLHNMQMCTAREERIESWPWRWGQLDGAYAPDGRHKDKEGLATITHHEGWTVMAMWDRSADSRGNSNAAFVARGDHNFAAMVAIAKEHFPQVWQRITNRQPVVQLGTNETGNRHG